MFNNIFVSKKENEETDKVNIKFLDKKLSDIEDV